MPISRTDTVWITSINRTEHAIDIDAYAFGLDRSGEYHVVCGDRILAAAMVETARARCRRCVAYLRARRSMRSLESRMAPRRRGRRALRRLLHLGAGDHHRHGRHAA